MTNGEKKAILLNYRAIERRINRLLDEKKRWEEKATAVTPAYSDMPKGGGSADKVQSAVCRIIEIEEMLNRQIDALADLREYIETALAGLPDEKLRDVMRYRYIDGMKWEEVAVAMHIDYRWVLRLHGRALAELTIESHY